VGHQRRIAGKGWFVLDNAASSALMLPEFAAHTLLGHLLMLGIQILAHRRNMGRFRTTAVIRPGNRGVSRAGHTG
jgi:hypothetical protein